MFGGFKKVVLISLVLFCILYSFISPVSAQITNGNVKCWGDNSHGQSNPYNGSDAIQVSTGVYHTCILKSNGNVECWGDTSYGRSNPYNGGDAIQLSAGWFHTCILKSNGNVECWGYNGDGQSNSYNGGDAIQVSGGGHHTCILKSNGNVECRGWNLHGQSNSYNGSDAIQVSAGYAHTCILKSNGNVECRGWNTRGQSNPYDDRDAIQVSADYAHTCILKSNGNVECWGRNYETQSNPYNGGDAIQVFTGGYHTCILKSNGNVECWGDNDYGQSNPYKGGDAIQVSAGYWHTCALINVEHCGNRVKDDGETDIDCGGSCPPCSNGKSCLVNSDCQSNYCDDSNICSIEVNGDIDPLLKTYAPVLYLHPDEEFFPKTIDSMLDESDLILNRIWPLSDRIIDEIPVAVESLSYENVTENYYLDMRDASGGYKVVNIPDPNRFHKYPNNIYGRVDNRHESLIVLQYWFFYPYNNWYNKHEGDWEMIQIILNKMMVPLVATYSFHHDANTIDWIDIDKIDGTHPKVFVAKGGHASYWDLSEHTYNTKKEKVSQIGPKLILNEDYTLTEIDNSIGWVNFLGTWGEPGSLGTGGPNSPANVRYNLNEPNRWDEPLKFAESTRSPDTTAIVTCPVNLHAYDTEGRHVGLNESGELELEIPELYLFLDEDEIKLIDIISSEPITFLIEATDNGAFNLSINKYERNALTEINIKYENINITNKTTAMVNITPTNPHFIMEIDEDGDNITDTTVEPDNITIAGVYNRTITLNLKEGWNLVSIPLILENNSVENVFKSINYSRIFSYDSGWDIPTKINYSMGLWIKVNEEANLTINGTLPFNPVFNLKQGYNLIGNPTLHISNVTEFFYSIKNNLTNIFSYENHTWKSYNTNKPSHLNTLKNIEPGHVYLVNVDTNVSLFIP